MWNWFTTTSQKLTLGIVGHPHLVILGDGGMQAIDAWFRPKNGMKYDWIGAVATVIRFIKQIETKYFCLSLIHI